MKTNETRIYARSLDLAAHCSAVCARMPRGNGALVHQLRRAALSVSTNFSEGCGREGIVDRRHFFTIARGSAREVCAILDVGVRFRAVSVRDRDVGVEIADHVANMLSRYR